MTNTLDAKERKEIFATLYGRAAAHDQESNDGGRFQAGGRPYATGSEPGVQYPRLPNSHQIWAGDPVEGLIDATDCSNTYDGTLTRGAPEFDNMKAQSAEVIPPSTGDGPEVGATASLGATPPVPLIPVSPQAHAQLTELMASGLRIKRRRL